MPDTVHHTFFLSRNIALKSALLARMVKGTQKLETQLCYYDGTPFADDPNNLICVPVERFSWFFTRTSLPLPTRFLDHAGVEAAPEMMSVFEDIIAEVITVRSELNRQLEGFPFQDTYYADRFVALHTALQQNRVSVGHPTITGLQICYYDGVTIDNAPPNLISVPAENLLEYLSNCRTRLPKCFTPNTTTSAEDISSGDSTFNALINQANSHRRFVADEYLKLIRASQPSCRKDRPFRVFTATDRRTQVLQYSARNLIKALDKLGQETCISIELNDMEELDDACHFKNYIEFNPNVVLNINNTNNTWLPADVFNFIWFQDPTLRLTTGERIPWRKRDFVFSAYKQFDELLENSGKNDVVRQGFCIDTDIFHNHYRIPRKEKVVFVGSSYRHQLKHATPEILNCSNRLIEHIEAGDRLTKELVETYRKRCNANSDYFYNRIFPYTVRDTAVRWLCGARQIDVEIYGWGWENDPIASNFFKGEIGHGEELAKVYNAAKYTLVASPHEIMSQRLAECSACGSIPVVYDVRHMSELPHCDDNCLFFNTKTSLYECLSKIPVGDPLLIATEYTFEHFAKRILGVLKKETGNINP